jgi:hypothetical protein
VTDRELEAACAAISQALHGPGATTDVELRRDLYGALDALHTDLLERRRVAWTKAGCPRA